MTVLAGILTFFLILAFLVLVHELGHFTVAKLTGVRVIEFGLGFPPRLGSINRGGTRYSLNAIPLGGFVRMAGENGEHDDPASFGAKPAWQRLLILVAGPGVNLLVAVAIFFVTFLIGSPRGLNIITAVQPGSPAAHAGLHAGDRVIAVDGTPVRYVDQIIAQTEQELGRRVDLRVQRGDRTFSVYVVPRLHPPAGQGAIGIALRDTTTIHYSPNAAVGQSFSQVGTVASAVPQLLPAVTQHQGTVQGPIGIARVTIDAVQAEPQSGIGGVLALVGFLSASLGVLNLLPIPALDGGRIVFVLVSWVRRQGLDPAVEGSIHLTGMALLLMLILFVSFHDVSSWIAGKPF